MSVFSKVPTPKHSVSNYRLKPVNTMSFDFGGIYPIFCKTVLPTDKWSMVLQSFLRTMPLMSPVLHRNDIKVDAFFVPFRLIWKSAEAWLECDTSIQVPKIYLTHSANFNFMFGPGSLYDYFNFGSPKYSDLQSLEITVSDFKRNMLPLRAYRFIYDYYYRNKSVEPEITDVIPDFYGDDDYYFGAYNAYLDMLGIQYRSWRRDLFTSALPVPQTGADILIPSDLTGTATGLSIVGDNTLKVSRPSEESRHDIFVPAESKILNISGSPTDTGENLVYRGGLKITGDRVNLRNQATIRQLRYAEFLEKYEEAMARAGFGDIPGYGRGKFKEWLKGIWNSRSSDARLDRPEYLGGYRGPIQISEIPQTSVSTAQSPQGNLAGKGLSVGGNRLFRNRYFEEPGVMMVLCSVVPKSAYCQGDPREWLYESGFDFPNPYFDHLGEQEVKAEEINCLAKFFPDEVQQTFGYNIRNYEMKDFPDEIHGALRDDLAFWHEGRMFDWDDFPGLNAEFLKIKPADVSRIFPSTETSNKLVAQHYFDIKLRRSLSYYGLPR